jgi:hypothetical protein
MSVICKYCNKSYASQSSRSNHIKKFHKIDNIQPIQQPIQKNETLNIQNIQPNIQNKCIKCDKILSNYFSRWRHEKKCDGKTTKEKENNDKSKDEEIIEMKKEMEKLKDMLQKALKIHPKTLQKINNQLNNTNNGTINNNTVIIQLGKEDLTKMLTMDEKMSILNRQAMGINDLVKLVHTSGKYQKCMNVYITNLQNTIGYMYDEKQNNFIAVNKNELLNDLVDSRMYDIEKFYDKLQVKLEPEKATRIKKFIDRMKNEEDCLKDLKKEEIKLILYNNRESISTILPKISPNEIDNIKEVKKKKDIDL